MISKKKTKKSKKYNKIRETRRKSKKYYKIKRKIKNKMSGGNRYYNMKSFPNEEKTSLYNEIQKYDKSIIKFYMNGCPHCENIKNDWNNLGSKINDEYPKKIGIFEVEVNEYPEKILYDINGVPEIIKVDNNGNEIERFEQERNLDNFLNFIKN